MGKLSWFRRIFARLFDIKDIEFLEETSVKELYKKNWDIAWPSVLEGALLSVINSADTIMVGTVGLSAIASVGLAAQPRMILLILGQSICVGTTAVVARRKGAGDRKAANACLKLSLIIVTILGLAMSLLGFFLAEPFMILSGANEDTMEMSVTYFKVISCAMVFNYWSLCVCAALKAIGLTRVTLITNLTSNIVNIIFNYLLIGGNFGFPRLGVLGAAIATAFGTFVSCCVAFYFVLRPGGYLHLKLFEKVVWDKNCLKGIFTVGSSSIAESVFLRIGFLINQVIVAKISTNVYATYQIVQQVSSLSFTVGDGLAIASTSLIGQSLGEKRKDLAKANVKITRNLSVVSAIILMAIVFFTRKLIPRLFTDVEAVIEDASIAFIVIAVGLIPQNGRIVYSGCLRGAGDAKYVAIISLISVTIVRPIATYIFCYPVAAMLPGMYFAVTGPWISFVIDSLLRDVLLKRRIDQGKWLDIKL